MFKLNNLSGFAKTFRSAFLREFLRCACTCLRPFASCFSVRKKLKFGKITL